MHRLRIGSESQANAEIDAETNRSDEIFAGNSADLFGDSQCRWYDRDTRLVSDAIVVDIEFPAVSHGGVDQSGRCRGQFFAGDEDRTFVGAAAQSLGAGERLLDSR